MICLVEFIPKIFSHQSCTKKKKSEFFPRRGPKKEKQLFDQRENYRMKKVLNTGITVSIEEFL